MEELAEAESEERYRGEGELRWSVDDDCMEKAPLFPNMTEVYAIKNLHQVTPFSL